jgi:hypothetical protein
MKKIIKLSALTLLVFSGFSALCAVEASASDVDFNIRFHDRRIYYVENDPIYVQITITNNSPNTYRFKLADDRAFSIDFDIRTMTNRQLAEADILIRKRTENSKVFFREIAIEAGEAFSFVEDLRDYVSLKQAGSFRVRAKVYPELYRTSVPAIESNYLSLNLRPPVIKGPDGIPLEMDVATGAVLVRQRLAPDEVVSYMIKARQESQWEKFFLYLDLETMLSRDAYQKRKWMAENEEGRRRMVAEYRQNMQNSFVDGDISVIPTIFNIERTVYDDAKATVTVLQKFRMLTFTELRRYTYYLEKRDNIWTIVDYSVIGLGTEAND